MEETMFRKLTLLVFTALAAMALTATTAHATEPVHIENDGDIEITGEHTIAIGVHHPSIGFIPGLRCNNHWTGTISESGAINLDNVNIDPHNGNDVGNCNEADDCGGNGWSGQVHEHEVGGFAVDFHFCISGQGGSWAGVAVEVECDLFNTEAHCDDQLFLENTGVGVTSSGLRVEVLGEVDISPNLGLMHG
ncbi:MAG TPA: hypothetical protein VEW67_09450 [Thermoleophilaceae bacterium]|nr:hypothetical protein [Thermoleophilaceae bacterium]